MSVAIPNPFAAPSECTNSTTTDARYTTIGAPVVIVEDRPLKSSSIHRVQAHATAGVATQMSTIISSKMMDPVPKNGRTAERLVMPLLNTEDHSRSPVQPNTKLSQINTTGILRMYPATMTDNTLTTFWGNAKVTDRSESTRAGPIRQSDCVVIHSKR